MTTAQKLIYLVKLVPSKDMSTPCHSTDARASDSLNLGSLLTVFSVHEGGTWTLPVGTFSGGLLGLHMSRDRRMNSKHMGPLSKRGFCFFRI